MDALKKFVRDWIMPICIAFLIAFLVNKFIFFNIMVPTESMYPTIKGGDRIIVTRVYDKGNLKRGDIIVFKSEEFNEKLIKRVIGTSGDKVEIKADGTVYVNDKKIDEPYVVNNGGKTGSFKVPEDSYFFLGDNRPLSLDSRYWKQHYISKESIEGKAQIIIFPFNRFQKLK